MADNALLNRAPLGWFGRLRTTRRDGRPMFDLKMQGTALFVDAARLYALGQGITATGTVERLDAVARALGVPAHERATWRLGFEALQRLRLQWQDRPAPAADNPNLIALDTLGASGLERLRQGVRAARLLQQRIELDYLR
jgi:CBS domain-containing protein